MAQFSVKPENAKVTAGTESRLILELSSLESEIRVINSQLGFQVAAKANIRNRLSSAADRVSGYRNSMSSMHSALQNVIDTYDQTEKKITGNTNVETSKIQNVSGNSLESSTDLSLLWKAVGAFGPAGKIVSTAGKVITGDRESGATWAKAASDIWKSGWKIGDVVKKCSDDTDVKWWEAIVGINKNSFLTSISKSNLSWQERALCGWNKGIKGTLREFKTTKGLVKQVGGIALSAIANGFSNYEEYQTGAITVQRAVAETITETAVDWGKDLLIGAAVTAGFAAAGFAAPVFAVGLATVAVSTFADWACEKVTGKKLTEAISDSILDRAESVANKIETGAKKVKEGASALWSNITNSWNTLTGSSTLKLA